MENLTRGRVGSEIYGGDQREVSYLLDKMVRMWGK
jgi:hypothetical protein